VKDLTIAIRRAGFAQAFAAQGVKGKIAKTREKMTANPRKSWNLRVKRFNVHERCISIFDA
jgi:hypothetical protein